MPLSDEKMFGMIGETVYEEAKRCFEVCGRAEDFCIQHVVEYDCIIFGGWNRVIWRPRTGIWADPSSCSKEFLEKFDQYKRGEL
jgi:hypothetical protein